MKRLTLLSARLVSLIRPLAALATAAALSASVAHAQVDKANAFFGQGAHAYYAGNFEEAVKYLDESVEAAGDTDPRPYYFRGLAHYRMDHKDLAQADFEAAARIEASDTVFPKLVNFSLERVQGNVRVMIEKYRLAAKAETRDRRAEERAARRSNLVELEKDVLRGSRTGAAPRLRYNSDFEDDAGLLGGNDAPAYSESNSTPKVGDGVEKMTEEPVAPALTSPEEMPAEEAPAKPVVPTLEAPDETEMPEKIPAPEKTPAPEATPAPEENPAAATPGPGSAPGRLGRLFGIFSKPLTDAAGSAAKGAQGVVPGAGGPPGFGPPPGPDGPGFGPGDGEVPPPDSF